MRIDSRISQAAGLHCPVILKLEARRLMQTEPDNISFNERKYDTAMLHLWANEPWLTAKPKSLQKPPQPLELTVPALGGLLVIIFLMAYSCFDCFAQTNLRLIPCQKFPKHEIQDLLEFAGQ